MLEICMRIIEARKKFLELRLDEDMYTWIVNEVFEVTRENERFRELRVFVKSACFGLNYGTDLSGLRVDVGV